MTFRPFTPTEGPAWLPKMAETVAGLFRRILPAPLRLFRSAPDLPDAGAYEGGLLWDAIEANVACSDGAGWKYWSFSDHVHGAAAVASVPAGSLSATNVQAALDELDAEKAPLASPGFTGTPTAPTAAAGTDTAQIATTAFVRTEVAALADAAPATLDTLNELAAALGDDADFATTVTNSLALKAPLASPTFTGTVTAPVLRLTDTTDVSLSSTGHAFQIGASAGGNLVIDENEIMARDNGAAADLFLNWEDGIVHFGPGGLRVRNESHNPVLTVDSGAVYVGGNYSGAASLICQGFAPTLFVQDINTVGGTGAQARINFTGSNGVLIGAVIANTTSAGYLSLNGLIGVELINSTVRFPNVGTTASAANAFLDAANSQRILRSTSSERYKTAITEIPAGQADKVLNLRPVVFRSTAEADDPNRSHWGLIAEQADSVLPILVNYDAEGAPDGVQYDRVIPGLLSVVKRLEARVAVLEGSAVAEGRGTL